MRCPGPRGSRALFATAEACSSETSTAQYIINNKQWGRLNPRVSCEHDSAVVALASPLPLPHPPKKKIHNLPENASPSNLRPPVRCLRDRSHRPAPIRESSPSHPCTGPPPKTSKRPRVDAIKNAHLKLSLALRGNSDGLVPTTSPEGTQPRRVPAQWARTIRLLAPVRGLTPPSTPLPFLWRAGTCSQTSSPRAMDFFLFLN